MALASKILCLNKHSIKMDMLWIKNTQEPKGTNTLDEDVSFKVSETAGDNYPMVDINGYLFKEEEILYVEFTESGILPTIRVTILDANGTFTNKYYPTSNALMKVYIKSKNENLKAIRCDFLITDIRGNSSSSITSGSSDGRNVTYSVTGKLNVPLLTNTEISSHKGTSFNVLNEMSKNINLGFATNEISTDDDMVWIQPNNTNIECMMDITSHAYKDENSFYTSYIDRYYNFTFVNLYNMMSQNSDTDAAYYEMVHDHEAWYKAGGHEKVDSKTDTVPNQLSNKSDFRGSMFYITKYSMKSNQGKIMMSVPMNEHIYYYDYNISDNPSDKFIEYDIHSHDTMKSKEEINNNHTNEWLGMDSGNIHDNYFFAEKFNYRNLMEMNKTNMIAEMEGVNLNLLRGMRIPVSIWREGLDSEFSDDPSSQKDMEDTSGEKLKDEVLQIELDRNLTGLYIINLIKFKYDRSVRGGTRWATEVTLSRANWGANENYSN